LHRTAAPRIWGTPHPSAKAGKTVSFTSMWQFEHRGVVFDSAGVKTGVVPKQETTDYGVYGYNLSAQWSPDEGDVEPFAVPYAPRHVQCRYDTNAGVLRHSARAQWQNLKVAFQEPHTDRIQMCELTLGRQRSAHVMCCSL
jgi:hypothetical protein